MEAHDCNFHDELQRCINDRCPLHRAMRKLASNLQIAALLCRAHKNAIEGGWAMNTIWSPGCGRSAP